MSNLLNSNQLRQFWREHVTACQDSGESAAVYCEHHQLVYHRFIYWRRKFRELDSSDQLTPSASDGFVRVVAGHAVASPCLSLALPNGLVIQEISAANVPVVRQLLEVL